MKTFKKTVIISICAVIVLCVFTLLICNPLRLRLYIGDRITGTVSASYNGEKIDLSDLQLTCKSDNSEDVINKILKESGKDLSFSLSDHEYGQYIFNLKIENDDLNQDAYFVFHQFNCWNVSRIDYSVDFIDMPDSKIAKVYAECTYYEDFGLKKRDIAEDEYDFTDGEKHVIHLG